MNSRINEIERFFKTYPDVSKEAIIKSDILRLGVTFTERALKLGEGFQLKSYYLFSFDRISLGQMGRKEYLRAPEEIRIHGGEYNLRPTLLAVRISEDSSYTIDDQEGKPFIFLEGRLLAEVEFHEVPEYYQLKFEDGTPYSDITSLLSWGYLAFTTIIRNCQYWGEKEECNFCDINENVRQQRKHGRNYIILKDIGKVVQVLETIFLKQKKGEAHTLLLSGGTLKKGFKGRKEEEFYTEYVEKIRSAVGNRWTCILQSSAKEKNVCKRMFEAGVNAHHANIEVWDRDLFKVLCPGKEKFVGRDEWIKRVIESVDVFGEGNVTPGFVAGVEMAQPYGFKTIDEAVKSTTEGIDYLMAYGVIPRFNHWCIEPGSALRGHPPIPLEYYVNIIRNWYYLWKKYNLPQLRGMGPVGPGRAILPQSAYLDVGF